SRPIREVTIAFLEWVCQELRSEGKKALLLVWDNAVLSQVFVCGDLWYGLSLGPMLPRRRRMAISFKGAHFPKDIILTGVRWYLAYPRSTRHVEELMLERGVHVDHSTINRWVIKYSPQLEEAFHRRKQPVWVSWRMDETYIKVKGEWRYLYT